jgi:hypothetical protein
MNTSSYRFPLILVTMLFYVVAQGQKNTRFSHSSDGNTIHYSQLSTNHISAKPKRENDVNSIPKNTRVQAHDLRKKVTKGFFGFSFGLNKYPLQLVNRYPAVKFDYAYKGESQIYHYADSSYLKLASSQVGWNLAMEFGRKKGPYLGFSAGGFFNRYVASNFSAELGYNLPIGKKFFLQPAISYTTIEFDRDFHQIPSNGKDIAALGKQFPYHSCSCGNSKYLRVGVMNNIDFLQYKFSVNYYITPYVILKFGYSYWSFSKMSTTLKLTNKAKDEWFRGVVYTSKDLTVKEDRSYSSAPVVLWQGSILFRFKPAPPGSYRSSSGHHYSSHAYGGSHSCH